MDSLQSILGGFFRGLKDSVTGCVAIFRYDREEPERQRRGSSPSQETNLAKRRAAMLAEKKLKQAEQKDETNVMQRVMQCCILNGLVFGMSMVLFDCVLLPILKLLLGVCLAEGDDAGTVWPYVQPVLTTVFNMLWVLPLFILSRLINTIWFQDIADSAYRQRQGRPQSFPSVSKFVADVLISLFIQALFIIQANIVMLVPLVGVGQVLGGIHMCMLNALYAFEYRWFNMGWELYKRLSFVEENWPYFLGFGCPLAVITMYPSSIYVSGCLFALLFPIFIISANEAEPVLNTNGHQLQLFSLVVGVSNRLIQNLIPRHHHTPSRHPSSHTSTPQRTATHRR